MTDDAPHVPVLLDEVVAAIEPKAGERIVDGTFGAGGYARAFLERDAQVVAFDRDPNVVSYAGALSVVFPGAFELVERPFSEMEEGLADLSCGQVDGVALDLGVSSMQLDEAGRGFSFLRDGPLDMRMSGKGPTAADLVNLNDETELARILFVYGEEKASRRIAKALVRRRAEQPFARTLDLADAIEQAVGGRKGAPVHPATRSFQALRIAVNDELGELEAGLAAAERVLKPGGRLAVVSFHSLEDRIVKNFLIERTGSTPAGSRHQPPAAKRADPSFELIFKGARGPAEAEAAKNPRARSAKLRAARRTSAPAWPSERRRAA
jgi:16S rRNA (cytosine1402-N4)-methyltransferase